MSSSFSGAASPSGAAYTKWSFNICFYVFYKHSSLYLSRLGLLLLFLFQISKHGIRILFCVICMKQSFSYFLFCLKQLLLPCFSSTGASSSTFGSGAVSTSASKSTFFLDFFFFFNFEKST